MCFFNDTFKYEEVYKYTNKGEIYLLTENNTSVVFMDEAVVNATKVRFCLHEYDTQVKD